MATKTKKKPAKKATARKPKAKPAPETNGHDPDSFPKDRVAPPTKKCPRCEADVELALEKCSCGHSFTDEPSSPDADEDARFRAKVEEMESECKQAEEEWEIAKSEAKEKKEIFEGLVAKLRQHIRGQNEPLPLFDKATTTVSSMTAGDETWRQDPIDVLSDDAIVGNTALSEALLAHFRKAQILTMGDLVDYTDPTKNGGYERRITDVDGIGKVAAEKVSEATIAYWAYRAAKAPPSPAEEAAPPEPNLRIAEPESEPASDEE